MAYLTTTGSGQPVLILKEGTTRSRGKEAQRNNIMAARVIGEVLKTTLGPRGMDKMLIDSLGDITITNDGAAILKEIDVEHPAAKMMVEIAKTQDDMVGDGTTSAVVLASELLKKAEELLDQNIHPIILVSGIRKASVKAIEVINKTTVPLDINDRKTLLKVALTSMSSAKSRRTRPPSRNINRCSQTNHRTTRRQNNRRHRQHPTHQENRQKPP
jgi:chaperonin GroEL (HSP60 family)